MSNNIQLKETQEKFPSTSETAADAVSFKSV